jgi:hypothetical protein
MKRILIFGILFLLSNFVDAQCAFTPTISPSALSLCPFKSDTLFTETADSYQWFKNGVPVSNNNLPFLVVSNPADINASILVVQTIAGCSESSAPALVSGISLPVMTIAIEGAVSGTACLGDTVNLTLNSGQTDNITWFRNGNPIAGQNSTSISIVQGGSYSATGAIAACPTNTQFSTDVVLAFSSAPIPQIFEDSNLGTLYTDATSNSLQWFEGGAPISNATTTSIFPSGAGQYTVTAQYSAGCTRISEPYIFSGFPVVCDHDPIVTGELLICPNGETTFSTISGDAFQWFVNGEAVSGAIENTFTISSLQAGSPVSVAVTVNGCTEISPEVTPLIYFFAPITLLANGNPGALCEGDSIEITMDNPGNQVTWLLNGEVQNSLQGPSVFVDQPGFYTANVVNEFCPALSQTTNEISVGFISNLIPEISIQGSSIVCSTIADTYTWSLNGNVVPGLTSATILAQPGIWTVTVSYNNGCQATSAPLDGASIGFEKISDGLLLLGPNPCTDQVHLRTRSGMLSVYSSEGKLIFRESISSGILSIETKSWNPGLYYFSWEGHSEKGSFLLVKQ